MEHTSYNTYHGLNQDETAEEQDGHHTPLQHSTNKYIAADLFKDNEIEVVNDDMDAIAVPTSAFRRMKSRLLGIKCFGFVVCFYIVCSAMTEMYVVAVITTIEKRFGFKSSSSGMLISGKEVAYVCFVAFSSQYADKWHRPRFLFYMAILGAFGGALSALPHFLYDSPFHISANTSRLTPNGVPTDLCGSRTHPVSPSRPTDTVGLIGNTSTPAILMSGYNGTSLAIATANAPNWTVMTHVAEPVTADLINSTLGELCGTGHALTLHNDGAYAIFMVSNVIIGFSIAPMIALTTTYVDDAVGPVRNAMYLAFMNMMRPLGPVLAFLQGAVFTSMHETMEDPGYGPSDPRWVGAWWIGYLSIPCLLLVAGILIAFFPRNMKQAPEDEDREMELKPTTPMKLGKDKHNFITDFAHAISRLLCNPVYMCLMFGGCFSSFLVSGMFPFMPKYIEVQFHLSTAMANALTGMLGALIAGIGVLLGGILTSCLKWRPTQSALFILVADIVFVITIFLMMAVSCPTTNYIDVDGSVNGTCSAACGCLGNDFNPVCGTDSQTYMSPCWAGCQTHNTNETYGDCACVTGVGLELSGSGGGLAYSGPCDSGCQMWIVYIAVFAAGALVGSMASVPGTTICLRCVEERDRAAAMGFTGTVVSLAGFVPGPALYGALIDSTCIKWQESCGETGYCRLYDNDSFRFRLHGTTAILKAVAGVFYFLVWMLMKREKKQLKFSTIVSKNVDADMSDSSESAV